jgi:hypothetical protein
MWPRLHRRVLQGLGWADPGPPQPRDPEEESALMGSVTNPTGSCSGQSLTGLQDAYAGNASGLYCQVDSAQPQFQHVVLLSDAADACGTGSPYVANEVTVRLVLWGYKDLGALPNCLSVYPPAADLPLVFTVPDVQLTTSDGVHRYAKACFMKARNNGGPGSDVWAIGGSVTLTRADNVQYEGSASLTFPSGGSFSGGFVAPWCGTAP